MLCVSFDRSYQSGVAFAIDLIKGIMHCLMSFTLGWVKKNYRSDFWPRNLCSHLLFISRTPPPLCDLFFFFFLITNKQIDTADQWDRSSLFRNLFVFSSFKLIFFRTFALISFSFSSPCHKPAMSRRWKLDTTRSQGIKPLKRSPFKSPPN